MKLLTADAIELLAYAEEPHLNLLMTISTGLNVGKEQTSSVKEYVNSSRQKRLVLRVFKIQLIRMLPIVGKQTRITLAILQILPESFDEQH